MLGSRLAMASACVFPAFQIFEIFKKSVQGRNQPVKVFHPVPHGSSFFIAERI